MHRPGTLGARYAPIQSDDRPRAPSPACREQAGMAAIGSRRVEMMKATFSRRLSPLELIHPDGAVERSLILGANCPERLRPERQCAKDERADLIVVAPSGDECRQEGWLRETAGEVERRLAPGGIVYVM